jgi:hypothetical protein
MGHEPVRLQSRQDVVSVDAEGAHEHVLGPSTMPSSSWIRFWRGYRCRSSRTCSRKVVFDRPRPDGVLGDERDDLRGDTIDCPRRSHRLAESERRLLGACWTPRGERRGCRGPGAVRSETSRCSLPPRPAAACTPSWMYVQTCCAGH